MRKGFTNISPLYHPILPSCGITLPREGRISQLLYKSPDDFIQQWGKGGRQASPGRKRGRGNKGEGGERKEQLLKKGRSLSRREDHLLIVPCLPLFTQSAFFLLIILFLYSFSSLRFSPMHRSSYPDRPSRSSSGYYDRDREPFEEDQGQSFSPSPPLFPPRHHERPFSRDHHEPPRSSSSRRSDRQYTSSSRRYGRSYPLPLSLHYYYPWLISY